MPAPDDHPRAAIGGAIAGRNLLYHRQRIVGKPVFDGRHLVVWILHHHISVAGLADHFRRYGCDAGRRYHFGRCGRDKSASPNIADADFGARQKSTPLNHNLCAAGQFAIVWDDTCDDRADVVGKGSFERGGLSIAVQHGHVFCAGR